MNQIHNLDESIKESFDFILKGHQYRFRQMTMEELEQFSKLEGNEQEAKQFLYNFVTKVDQSSPDFSEIATQMYIPQWKRFTEMLKTEFMG